MIDHLTDRRVLCIRVMAFVVTLSAMLFVASLESRSLLGQSGYQRSERERITVIEDRADRNNADVSEMRRSVQENKKDIETMRLQQTSFESRIYGWIGFGTAILALLNAIPILQGFRKKE